MGDEDGEKDKEGSFGKGIIQEKSIELTSRISIQCASSAGAKMPEKSKWT